MDRGGIFRKSKRCGGRSSEYVTLLLTLAFHLPHCRHTTFDRGEPRKGDTSRDDQFDEAVMDTTPSAQGSGEGMKRRYQG